MDRESLEKFRAQVEILSAKEVERVMKRLSKEEFDVGIDALEKYNMELNKKLEDARSDLQQRLENYKMLLNDVWNVIPDDVRKHLAEHYKSMRDIL
ncbi:ECU09_0275 [Encephalitozoon cuniculi GB-M1]|uniref:ECU09_0275 protein n=1 Tax=Encephalitozoon cuniculi (strain GB-M1) TaxID=284813 RepID=I7KFY6_ENCCU|nr:uncharacterized protein ECU09_0275 [Encephalitozoon cuniculi GB-M1]UYI26705.1 hypothetical protein J0A71_03g05410 [Encephalitozoon cuniculi]CCI73973.1 ECU09_0275 [Encephalitozoon cuniculi GB-M1]